MTLIRKLLTWIAVIALLIGILTGVVLYSCGKSYSSRVGTVTKIGDKSTRGFNWTCEAELAYGDLGQHLWAFSITDKEVIEAARKAHDGQYKVKVTYMERRATFGTTETDYIADKIEPVVPGK